MYKLFLVGALIGFEALIFAEAASADDNPFSKFNGEYSLGSCEVIKESPYTNCCFMMAARIYKTDNGEWTLYYFDGGVWSNLWLENKSYPDYKSVVSGTPDSATLSEHFGSRAGAEEEEVHYLVSKTKVGFEILDGYVYKDAKQFVIDAGVCKSTFIKN